MQGRSFVTKIVIRTYILQERGMIKVTSRVGCESNPHCKIHWRINSNNSLVISFVSSLPYRFLFVLSQHPLILLFFLILFFCFVLRKLSSTSRFRYFLSNKYFLHVPLHIELTHRTRLIITHPFVLNTFVITINY